MGNIKFRKSDAVHAVFAVLNDTVSSDLGDGERESYMVPLAAAEEALDATGLFDQLVAVEALLREARDYVDEAIGQRDRVGEDNDHAVALLGRIDSLIGRRQS